MARYSLFVLKVPFNPKQIAGSGGHWSALYLFTRFDSSTLYRNALAIELEVDAQATVIGRIAGKGEN